MNYIQKLLNDEKVEWKTLGEVAKLSRGRVISKDFLRDNEGEYPVYSSQTLNNGELGKINSFDFDGDFLTWTTDGAHAGTIFKRSGKFSITNVCGLIDNDKAETNLNFLYHWLSSVAKKYVYSGMGNPKLMSNQMEKVKIPIPPLPVQQKIAEILDRFAELEAELEAELHLREKQYNYYRNHLLTPNEQGLLNGKKVEWKTLGEVADLQRGTSITAKNLSEGEIPVIAGGQKPAYFHSEFNRNGETIVVAGSGAYAGFTSYWNEPIFVSDAFSIKPKNEDELLCKYVFYFLKNKQNDLYGMKKGGGVPHVYAKDVGKLEIPILSMEEQKRIVKILDTFDTLVNSISEGLPKEIALRRKQYEYYREQLLSF